MKKGVSGTKEWSSSSVNVMSGCRNGCWYCYAKAMACSRLKTKTPNNWTAERPVQTKLNKSYGKRQGVIMYPTAHDLTPLNIKYTLPTLFKLLRAENRVLVVSKPHPDVIEEICEKLKDFRMQVLFRFTIGSMDPDTLALWEPNAPTFAERLYALMYARKEGWDTSVSMEPMLDLHEELVIQAIDTMSPYVSDAIWLGKMNHISARLKINKAPQPVLMAGKCLEEAWDDDAIFSLYNHLRSRPAIKWKESIKKIVGIEVPTEAGLDI